MSKEMRLVLGSETVWLKQHLTRAVTTVELEKSAGKPLPYCKVCLISLIPLSEL